MNLFNSYSSLIKSSGAGDKVFALLDRHPPPPATGSELVQNFEGQTLGSERTSLSIQFQNVGFSYPSRPEHQILHGLDLNIGEGQTIALVGVS